MDAAFARLYKTGACAFGAYPTVAASSSEDEVAACIAMQLDPDPNLKEAIVNASSISLRVSISIREVSEL